MVTSQYLKHDGNFTFKIFTECPNLPKGGCNKFFVVNRYDNRFPSYIFTFLHIISSVDAPILYEYGHA